jgi:hypothetical protein
MPAPYKSPWRGVATTANVAAAVMMACAACAVLFQRPLGISTKLAVQGATLWFFLLELPLFVISLLAWRRAGIDEATNSRVLEDEPSG